MMIKIAKKIVVIGSGIAAVTAIKAIIEIDSDSEICLIGEEKFYPYNRIRLSKGIFDELNENNILLQKKEWYEDNNVKVYLDTRATSVSADCQEVVLSNGSKVTYDKLLLANGSANTIPPIDGIGKDGIYTLRGLKDALNIKKRLEKSEKVVIIGGGIQGLEIAWILHQHGKKVIIVELLSRVMYNQIDDEASKILRNTIESYGIKVLTDKAVKKIVGGESVEKIVIDENTELNCDIAIYSTGIKPNIDLVANTRIETARGILVNNKMETNIKNIYAAGDIAEFNHRVPGLWNIAIAQGKVAGYNICGKETLYENITPVTTLNAFGISLFSMGRIEQTQFTKMLINQGSGTGDYKKIFVSDNKIVGAIVIGDTKKSPLLKSAIEQEVTFSDAELSERSADELLEQLKNSYK